jgi:hypothetical protein
MAVALSLDLVHPSPVVANGHDTPDDVADVFGNSSDDDSVSNDCNTNMETVPSNIGSHESHLKEESAAIETDVLHSEFVSPASVLSRFGSQESHLKEACHPNVTPFPMNWEHVLPIHFEEQ